MTFAKFSKILTDTGKLPPSGRPAASAYVRSAEGLPSRNLGIDVRPPKPITPAQAKWLREQAA